MASGTKKVKGKETEERMKMSFKKRSGASRKVEEVKDHRLVGSWGGVKVVDSRRYLIVDGNFVIPADDVHLSSLERSMKAVGWKRHEVWKQHNPIGRADYYDIVLRLEGGKVLRRNRCAAWTYPVGPHVYYLTTNFASFVKLMTAKGQWEKLRNSWCFSKGIKYTLEKSKSFPAKDANKTE